MLLIDEIFIQQTLCNLTSYRGFLFTVCAEKAELAANALSG